VTDRPATSKAVVDDLADVVDAKLSAADYAMAERKLFDLLVEGIGDAEWVREFCCSKYLCSSIGASFRSGTTSLSRKCCLSPPARKRGRPKDGFGKTTYDKRYQLYVDWTYASAINPLLTKLQFAKQEAAARRHR
jgi:hypothetical protein